jgi:hypothetical protein
MRSTPTARIRRATGRSIPPKTARIRSGRTSLWVLWPLLQESLCNPLFPNACQVLDYYHCSAYLHTVAKAQYGQTFQALEWVEATLTRLYMGQVGTVLGGLRRMQPTSAEALKAIDNCGSISMTIGAGLTTASFAAGALRWGAAAWNRRTHASAMYA